MSDFLEFPDFDSTMLVPDLEKEKAIIEAKVNKIMDKIRWTEADEEKYSAHVKSDPKAQAYLETVKVGDLDYFLKSYFTIRKHVTNLAAIELHYKIKYPKGHNALAESYFWQIQQKKLFDMQCLWRAGQIDIPQIKTTQDFKYWEHAIEFCPFIEPVQSEDVELLKRFLRDQGYELGVEEHNTLFFQYYEDFKSEDEEDEDGFDKPLFYDYWDAFRGTTYLSNLPNVRGEREDFYHSLFIDKVILKGRYETQTDKPAAPLPLYFNPDDFDNIESFIDLFEDKEFKRIFAKHKDHEQMLLETEDFSLLDVANNSEEMPKDYPIVTIYPSWRKNIAATLSKYEHDEAADSLDAIYEMYCMRREMDLDIDLSEDKIRKIEHQRIYSEDVRRHILDGRELAGEPKDWSFL